MKGRRVQVFKRVRLFVDGKWTYKNEHDYVGVFHAWGVDHEEFDGGPGNFTCAVVEMDNVMVETPPAHMIKFLDRETA